MSKTSKSLPRRNRFDQPVLCKTPHATLKAVRDIYGHGIEILRDAFLDYANGKIPKKRVRAFYPYVRLKIDMARRADSRLSYGFAPRAGTYGTTLTRPDIFEEYFLRQFELLLTNHHVPLEVGISQTPIPVHFALGEHFHLEKSLSADQTAHLADVFDVPNLDILDDEIANGTYVPPAGSDDPLSLFIAPRVDLSLQRLKHYTGTSAAHFQNYVIFTNYQFYVDEFIRFGQSLMARADSEPARKKRADYQGFVTPWDQILPNENSLPAQASRKKADAAKQDKVILGASAAAPGGRAPQMPAYHLKLPSGKGITMVNIGVGPSNAKTITDHIAVLRPHAWLMLGHCAGLRNSQHLGDYVLAHAYLREDHILDDDLPLAIPVPALAEIQQALETAVAEVTGLRGYDLKKIMRTGTVATTDDRNWELRSSLAQNRRLSQSRAIAMDMESGTIAANGFRFRVPYGTLLCVSDKPLHGQLKLPGMANQFYRERVEQHLKIGLRTMDLLRSLSPEQLHSRKLRSFNEVAFQ
jgi:AMP nucleosidase